MKHNLYSPVVFDKKYSIIAPSEYIAAEKAVQKYLQEETTLQDVKSCSVPVLVSGKIITVNLNVSIGVSVYKL